MKKTLIVSYCMPQSYAKWVFSKDPIPGIQSNTFAHSLVRVFEHTGMQVDVLSSAPVQDYPICPIPDLPEVAIEFPNAKGIVFATSNKPIRKRIQRMQRIVQEAVRQKPDYLVIHGLYLPYIFAGAVLSLMGYRTALVLTDPSGVILQSDGLIRRVLKRVDGVFTQTFTKRFRYGIALSPELLNKYMPKCKHLVFPGIFPEQNLAEGYSPAASPQSAKTGTLSIGYFGGVFPGYGVLEFAQLIAASDLPITLGIYGSGSELPKIEEVAARDNRIRIMGIVEREKALGHMRSYDVLVNPRTPETKMEENSFPSKIFDYALTERAIMTTPLKRLPLELREDLFEYNSHDSADALAMLSILSGLSRDELNEKGCQFSQNLRAEYNSASLGQKVKTFFEDSGA